MVSTYLNYQMYTSDYARSEKKTLANPQVSREQDYYRENIGKVTSVDEFLDDQRLYAYAMKAYGLEDMTYAKAFMRKVLESDLTDESSFARQLSDTRYQEFARAFNFAADGTVETGTAVAQDESDIEDLVGLYSERRGRTGTEVATEAEYYQARISTITSAKEFVSDARLFNFALTAYGIDASIASESAIAAVISGDLSGVATSENYSKYQALANAFSFQEDGSLPEGEQSQSAEQLYNTVSLNYEANSAEASSSAAAFKTRVFTELVADIATVDALVDNTLLRDYALVAAGLEPTLTSDQMVRDILTSDLTDPDSYANSQDGYAKLASMFNFNVSGSLDEGLAAQTEEQRGEMISLYYAAYEVDALSADQAYTEDYRSAIGSISSVNDLLKDDDALAYVLDAYGIDPDDVSTETIRKVLTSDPDDRSSYAHLTRDARFTAIAAAFNFGADGNAQGALQAQYSSAKSDTVTRYEATLGEYDYQKEAGEVETEYYSSVIDSVETVDELLSDSRALSYLKQAYGLDDESNSLFKSELRKVLTSDPSQTDSFANQSGNETYRELARAFNFDSDGNAKRVGLGSVQDPNSLVETQDLFIRQTMETTAGEESEGVRLALYFERKAPSITNTYSILADKALFEVVTTALGLPDEIANMDTDALATYLESRIDLEDFKDAGKLEKFIAKFAAMYDIENQDSSTSAASILFGQSDSSGISEALLANIQSLNTRS